MATEKSIKTQTGELVLWISDESPWKEQALAVLCEQALQQLLVGLRAQHGAIAPAAPSQTMPTTAPTGREDDRQHGGE
ncbi:MAG: hypothetical protein NVV60_13605 [Luteimonas sp.]|nr:hypothetical protein [Luteimonas sp.]